jgi:hypothetical protein
MMQAIAVSLVVRFSADFHHREVIMITERKEGHLKSSWSRRAQIGNPSNPAQKRSARSRSATRKTTCPNV